MTEAMFHLAQLHVRMISLMHHLNAGDANVHMRDIASGMQELQGGTDDCFDDWLQDIREGFRLLLETMVVAMGMKLSTLTGQPCHGTYWRWADLDAIEFAMSVPLFKTNARASTYAFRLCHSGCLNRSRSRLRRISRRTECEKIWDNELFPPLIGWSTTRI